MLSNRVGNRRGFVVVTTAVSMVALLALAGLATDVGRLYVAHNELQVFADEAAIAATFELDGTLDGLVRARSVAASGPVAGAVHNRWNFGTETVQAVEAQFSPDPNGPFEANPAAGTGYRFIKVRASVPVKIYFLLLVPGIPAAQNVSVTTVAGQSLQTTLGDGLAPFSPDAHDPSDPDFGFTAGQLYTLRWAPPGKRNKGTGSCPGDQGYDPDGSGDRGYIDVGQGGGNAGLRDAIVNNTYNLANPLEIGSPLEMVSGEKSITSEIDERFAQDNDLTAANFSRYRGNGRRLFTVAVNNGADPARVVGFALFFLQPSPCGSSTNTSACCAEYVGSSVVGGSHKGAGSAGVYAVQLVQ